MAGTQNIVAKAPVGKNKSQDFPIDRDLVVQEEWPPEENNESDGANDQDGLSNSGRTQIAKIKMISGR